MNNKCKNIYIFNTCFNYCCHPDVILNLYVSAGDRFIDEKFIIKKLGISPATKQILREYRKLDYKKISCHALVVSGVSEYHIKKIRKYFKYVNDIDTTKLLGFGFQRPLVKKIESFINEFITKPKEADAPVSEKILLLLKTKQSPISRNDLVKEFTYRYKNESIQLILDEINKLSKSKKIKITYDGIEISRIDIKDFFKDFNNCETFKNLYKYLSSNLNKKFYNTLEVSKAKFERWAKTDALKLPLFNDEWAYKKLFEEYWLSNKLSNCIGYDNILLSKYVILKYGLKPTKGDIEYIIEHNMVSSDIGNEILKENRWFYVNNHLIPRRFILLFNEFINQNKITHFVVPEIFESFNKYTNDNGIVFDVNEVGTLAEIIRKIDNSGIYLCYGKKRYICYHEKDISSSFIKISKKYLLNFYGFGSVEHFFVNNSDLCKKQNINDKYQLHSIWKKMFHDELSETIEFGRSPTINTPNLTREKFLSDLLAEWEPIKIEDFVTRINKLYGMDEGSFRGSPELRLLEKKYKDHDGLLRSNIYNINFNSPESRSVLSIINNQIIYPYDKFIINLHRQIKDKVDIYSSRFTLKKLGYSLSADCIYSSKYSSLLIAIDALSKQLPKMISIDVLNIYFPLGLIERRDRPVLNEAFFLRSSSANDLNPKFININQVTNRKRILAYRDEIVSKLIFNKIYTLQDLKDSTSFKRISTKYNDIDGLVVALGDSFLASLLKSSLEITILQSSKYFVFGTGELVTIKRIIKDIVWSRGSIDKDDLFDLLLSKYGVSIENKFSLSYIEELNLYYNKHLNKIYSSKRMYEDEITQLLDKGE